MTFGNRPLLIFNHNPKAGGGTILEVLQDFKPHECRKQVQTHEYYQYDREKEKDEKKEKMGLYAAPPCIVDDSSSFVNIIERQRSDLDDRMNGFIISSIREPCSHYVSLWSYGSNGKGGAKNIFLKHHQEEKGEQFFGQDPPYFNSTRDVTNFSNWLHANHGYIHHRFEKIYGEDKPEIDCWVFVEDLQSSLLKCLEMYENQGGYVDWNASAVKQLVNGNDEVAVHSKNSIAGNPQGYHHAPCSTYFDDTLSHYMENGPEKNIYQMFGYKGCCLRDHHEFSALIVDENAFLEDEIRRTTVMKQGGILSSLNSIKDNDDRFAIFAFSFVILAATLLASVSWLVSKCTKGEYRKIRRTAVEDEDDVIDEEK